MYEAASFSSDAKYQSHEPFLKVVETPLHHVGAFVGGAFWLYWTYSRVEAHVVLAGPLLI